MLSLEETSPLLHPERHAQIKCPIAHEPHSTAPVVRSTIHRSPYARTTSAGGTPVYTHVHTRCLSMVARRRPHYKAKSWQLSTGKHVPNRRRSRAAHVRARHRAIDLDPSRPLMGAQKFWKERTRSSRLV
jgi:hypothetical protein